MQFNNGSCEWPNKFKNQGWLRGGGSEYGYQLHECDGNIFVKFATWLRGPWITKEIDHQH
jgi:hypothetical protein